MVARLALLLLCLHAPLVAQTADLKIRAAEIVGYGICELGASRPKFGFTRLAPPGDLVQGVHFVEFTHDIPGELGTSFGVEYVINSYPRGAELEVTTLIKFPDDGMKTPGGRVYRESREDHKVRLGHKEFYGYRFDEPWEIVPGEWVIEVWHGRGRLIRKAFTVLDPEGGD